MINRKYKRAESVNVYPTQEAKDDGIAIANFEAVPYSRHGFDSYEYQGRIYRGWFDTRHPHVDACIILDLP